MAANECILILILFSLKNVVANSSEEIVIYLNNGGIKGGEMKAEDGRIFYAFRGIPYAEPPLANLRFRPPVPKSPWKGVLDATKDGPPCPQIHFISKIYIGSEDCLYLNVYLPKLPSKDGTLLDVIFHIHGGGFLFGEGSSKWYGPRRFNLDDVILVSLTYRVSVLGFLSTQDSASRGNYGLLDQTEALRWVRNNIRDFGGNPDSVTILGESAGGASVIFHMLTPLSEGWFRRAVSMSGSAACNWALQKDPQYWAKRLAENLNCSTEDSESLVECLRQKSAKELILKGTFGSTLQQLLAFTPVVDNFFISDSPVNLLKGKNFNNDVPLLIGATKDEGACFSILRENPSSDFTDKEILETLKRTIECRQTVDQTVHKIKAKYFSSLSSYKEMDVQPLLAKALTDGMFHKYIWFTAKTMMEAGTETYIYSYDYEAPFSGSLLFGKKRVGVCHADDLFMLFDGPTFPVKSFDKTSARMKDEFQKRLKNFVMHGKPFLNADGQEDCAWPAALPDLMHVFRINEKCSTHIYVEKKDELYDFWVKEIPEDMIKILPLKDEL